MHARGGGRERRPRNRRMFALALRDAHGAVSRARPRSNGRAPSTTTPARGLVRPEPRAPCSTRRPHPELKRSPLPRSSACRPRTRSWPVAKVPRRTFVVSQTSHTSSRTGKCVRAPARGERGRMARGVLALETASQLPGERRPSGFVSGASTPARSPRCAARSESRHPADILRRLRGADLTTSGGSLLSGGLAEHWDRAPRDRVHVLKTRPGSWSGVEEPPPGEPLRRCVVRHRGTCWRRGGRCLRPPRCSAVTAAATSSSARLSDLPRRSSGALAAQRAPARGSSPGVRAIVDRLPSSRRCHGSL